MSVVGYVLAYGYSEHFSTEFKNYIFLVVVWEKIRMYKFSYGHSTFKINNKFFIPFQTNKKRIKYVQIKLKNKKKVIFEIENISTRYLKHQFLKCMNGQFHQ